MVTIRLSVDELNVVEPVNVLTNVLIGSLVLTSYKSESIFEKRNKYFYRKRLLVFLK
jgi:hypothetical protein